MARGLVARINQKALLHNVTQIRKIVSCAKILAMVKANAYGHDIITIARLLDGKVEALGVACLEEACLIQSEIQRSAVVLMEGFFQTQELDEILAYQFQPVIHNTFQLSTILNLKQPLKLWLKFDTGMHRLGFHIGQASEIVEKIQTNPYLTIQGIMSHLACADDMHDIKNQQQLQRFEGLKQTLGNSFEYSLANSAGILAWPSTHEAWVRPGLMLYGVSPFENTTGSAYHLEPVMTLQTEIIAKHQVRQGESIGYKSQFICPEDMPIGIVAVGYGDGYPQHLPNGAPVVIQGIQTKIIGRVAMDMAAVDLRPCPTVDFKETVTLWGGALPVETVAEYSGMSCYSLLTALSARVARVVDKPTQRLLQDQGIFQPQ